LGPYRWTSVSGDTDLTAYAIGQAIRRTDGTYLAIGTAQERRILRSADGRTWTVEPGDPGLLAAPTNHIALVDGIAEGSEGLVAVGAMALDDISSGDARAWTSPDGVTWQAAEVSDATDAAMEAVADGPKGFVAVGSDGFPGGNVQLPGARAVAVWTSDDGTRWTRAADQQSLHDAIMLGVRAVDTGYVAWGQTLVGQAASQPPPVWTSPDGVHWDRASGISDAGGPGTPIASIIAINGRLVAVGSRRLPDDQGGGYLPAAWTSPDGGRTWTASTMNVDLTVGGVSGNIFDVATDGSDLVAVGYLDRLDGIGSAAVWRSTDQGSTWTRLDDHPAFAGASLRRIVSMGTRGSLVFGQSDDPNGGATMNRIWLVEPIAP
jgi:hypothetical protein